MKYILLFSFLMLSMLQSHAQFSFSTIEINPYGSSNVSRFAEYKGRIYFSASDSTHGSELWASDGTISGTVLIKDIYTGTGSGNPIGFLEYNAKLYFFGTTAANGYELWVTDGTEAGTHLVKDINPRNTAGTEPFNLKVINNKLIFNADDSIHGREVWVSDGTTANTVMLADMNPGPASNCTDAIAFETWNNILFYRGSSVSSGDELWISDGTVGGTKMLKDIYPGKTGSIISNFNNTTNKMFFSASDSIHGKEVWETDGTLAGTKMVKDIFPGMGPSNPQISKGNYNGKIAFTANDQTHGSELWFSDGTDTGTSMVKDILPGKTGSNAFGQAALNGKYYFQANDSITGIELWETDGTTAGTRLVKDILPGVKSSTPYIIGTYSGKLIIIASNNGDITNNDRHLYVSDGTNAGTFQIEPPGTTVLINPIGLSFPIIYKNSFYFGANYINGYDLWILRDTVAFSGIKNKMEENDIHLYPNPSNGKFTLEWNEQYFQKGSIFIYDILGHLIFEQPIQSLEPTMTLDLNLPSGIYYLKLCGVGLSLTKKFSIVNDKH